MSFEHCDLCGERWVVHGTACPPKQLKESQARRDGREAYKSGKSWQYDNPYNGPERDEWIGGWCAQRFGN